MSFPLEEPAANTRQAAQAMREMFVALVNAGFTESQALELVSTALRTAMDGKEPG